MTVTFGDDGMLAQVVESVMSPAAKVIYLCPDGEPLNEEMAKELTEEESLVIDDVFRQVPGRA